MIKDNFNADDFEKMMIADDLAMEFYGSIVPSIPAPDAMCTYAEGFRGRQGYAADIGSRMDMHYDSLMRDIKGIEAFQGSDAYKTCEDALRMDTNMAISNINRPYDLAGMEPKIDVDSPLFTKVNKDVNDYDADIAHVCESDARYNPKLSLSEKMESYANNHSFDDVNEALRTMYLDGINAMELKRGRGDSDISKFSQNYGESYLGAVKAADTVLQSKGMPSILDMPQHSEAKQGKYAGLPVLSAMDNSTPKVDISQRISNDRNVTQHVARGHEFDGKFDTPSTPSKDDSFGF